MAKPFKNPFGEGGNISVGVHALQEQVARLESESRRDVTAGQNLSIPRASRPVGSHLFARLHLALYSRGPALRRPAHLIEFKEHPD